MPTRIATLLLLLSILARSSIGSACGCCGGGSNIDPIGWSARGNSLLVQRQRTAYCETAIGLEVWRRGQTAPAACFDLQRDPNRVVACNALSRGGGQSIRSSRRAALYPREARILRSDRVRVIAGPGRGDTLGIEEPPAAWMRDVRIEVRASNGWHPVWSGEVFLHDGGEGADEVLFDIWPSPTSNAALLRIQDIDPMRRGHDSPYHDTRLIWITLPEGMRDHTLSQRNARTLEDPRRYPISLPRVGDAR